MDEWPGEPVNWSQHWAVEVEADGRFAVDINTPPRPRDHGQRHVVGTYGPSISRRAEIRSERVDQRGPERSPSLPSVFSTTPFSPRRVPCEFSIPVAKSPPTATSGWSGKIFRCAFNSVTPKGLLTPWRFGRGWRNVMTQTGTGRWMKKNIRMETVSVNLGVTQAEIDLPLLSWSSVTPFHHSEEGRASVVRARARFGWQSVCRAVVSSERIADLATIFGPTEVRHHRRQRGLIHLDRVDGSLLAGKNHSFSIDHSLMPTVLILLMKSALLSSDVQTNPLVSFITSLGFQPQPTTGPAS